MITFLIIQYKSTLNLHLLYMNIQLYMNISYYPILYIYIYIYIYITYIIYIRSSFDLSCTDELPKSETAVVYRLIVYIYIHIHIHLCFLFIATLQQHIHTLLTLISHSQNLFQLVLLDH